MASTKKMITGAAIGSLIGSLAAVLYPRRHEIIDQIRDHYDNINDLKEKALEYGESFMNNGKNAFRRVEYRDNYWKGGLLGLIVGVGAALLTAPSTGKALRKQLSDTYNDLSEKSEEVIHHFKNGHYNPFAHQKSTRIHAKKKKKPSLKAKAHRR